jgi:hypothetical protein
MRRLTCPYDVVQVVTADKKVSLQVMTDMIHDLSSEKLIYKANAEVRTSYLDMTSDP